MCWETHLGYWGGKERENDATRERLYTKAQLLVHLETCEEANAILAKKVSLGTNGGIVAYDSANGVSSLLYLSSRPWL